MRPSRGTPISIIPVSVNMHAALSIRVVAGDVPGNGRLGALGGLLKGHGALDVGVATEDGNCGGGRSWLAKVIFSGLGSVRLVGEIGGNRSTTRPLRVVLGGDAVCLSCVSTRALAHRMATLMVTITVYPTGSRRIRAFVMVKPAHSCFPVSSIIGQLPLLVCAVYSDVPALTISAVLRYCLFLVYGVCECDWVRRKAMDGVCYYD